MHPRRRARSPFDLARQRQDRVHARVDSASNRRPLALRLQGICSRWGEPKAIQRNPRVAKLFLRIAKLAQSIESAGWPAPAVAAPSSSLPTKRFGVATAHLALGPQEGRG